MSMEIFDISKLSSSEAKAYLVELATSLKMYEKDIASLSNEANIWKDRISLAASKGSTDLEEKAKLKLQEILDKIAVLESERKDIALEVNKIREKLPMLDMAALSIDTDLLLANLRISTGQDPDDRTAKDTDNLDKNLSQLSISDQLSALKEKINKKTDEEK